jgi:transposase-like protein
MDGPAITVIAESESETAHKIGHKSARGPHVEIITGKERRRTWTLEQKREIVTESLGPALTPTEVARKHSISSGQLYTWRQQVLGGQMTLLSRATPDFAQVVSMPVEISPEVPVENSSLHCGCVCLGRGMPRCSEPSRDARCGARRKRFHPLTASALHGDLSRSGRKASRGIDRLRQVEQKAAQEGGSLGGRPRRRGALSVALGCCGGRRLSGIRSACWRSR